MGGGSSHSTTNPTIPPQLSGLYTEIGRALTGSIRDMPLSDFYQMDPRQYADMSQAEQAALGLAPGMLNASPSAQAAYNMASNLGNMNDWYGADLNGVGALSPFQLGSPIQIGMGAGMPGQGGGAPPAGPGQQPRPGGGGPVGGGGFGFTGSAYQGGQAPPPGQQRKLPMPFQAVTPAVTSSS